MGKRAAIVYLATIALGAFAGGLLLDQMVTADQVVGAHMSHWMLPGLLKNASAIILLGVLLTAILQPLRHRLMRKPKEASATFELAIAGMTCNHCKVAIRRALLACPGVASVEVDLEANRARVWGLGADPAEMRRAVQDLGYTVVETGSNGDEKPSESACR
jgi:copper chaperone CopZ